MDCASEMAAVTAAQLPVKLGTVLLKIGRKIKLSVSEHALFEVALERDRTPVEPVRFD
jgi:hypothetical protein